MHQKDCEPGTNSAGVRKKNTAHTWATVHFQCLQRRALCDYILQRLIHKWYSESMWTKAICFGLVGDPVTALEDQHRTNESGRSWELGGLRRDIQLAHDWELGQQGSLPSLGEGWGNCIPLTVGWLGLHRVRLDLLLYQMCTVAVTAASPQVVAEKKISIWMRWKTVRNFFLLPHYFAFP